MTTEIEERLRRALGAKAGQITPDRLQPAVPPTAAPRRRSWRLRWWPLVAAAGLVAVVVAVRLPGDTPPRPVPNPPAATVPTPGPSLSPAPTGDPSPTGSGPTSPRPTGLDPTGTSTRPTVAPTPPAATPGGTPTRISTSPAPRGSTAPTG
jgi:hypothetical protein